MVTANLQSFDQDYPSGDLQFVDPFDPMGFPDDFPSDFSFNPFDLDVEFSVEGFLDCPDIDFDFPSDHRRSGLDDGECIHPMSSAGGSDCKEGLGSGVSSTSSPLHRNSSNDLPNSANFSPVSPDSGNSDTTGVVVECTDLKLEERKGLNLKRKKKREDEEGTWDKNPNVFMRRSKSRKSGHFDDVNSLCLSDDEKEEDQKKKARLIRNRESAQLSRQRKKKYVEELEDKLRSMHSIITDLNGKISYFMAENASLRKQLGGTIGNVSPPSSAYPPIYPITPVHYPWIPCSGYALRPSGLQVPLIPIPKMKPHIPTSAANLKKSEQPSSAFKSEKLDGKKRENKIKKVASISILVLLFNIFFVGFLLSGVDFGKEGYSNLFRNEYGEGIVRISGQSNGSVLPVTRDISNLNQTDEVGLYVIDKVCQKNNLDKFHVNGGRCVPDTNLMQTEIASQASEDNSNRPLHASLYVPRNDRLFKIDGNLIISSVLACEKATIQTSSEFNHLKITQTSVTDGKETSLAIAGSPMSSFPVSKSDRDARTQSYGRSTECRKALPSSSDDKYKYNIKPNSAHAPPKEWFREGLEGPVFLSGMCTEVFQFDVSPSSESSGGTLPVDLLPNGTIYNTRNSSQTATMRNRRILYSHIIPSNGSTTLGKTRNRSTERTENSSFGVTKHADSMVVSVLIDPQEAADSDGITRQPKSEKVSGIFVVVLVDNVKYITYSCLLPFLSSPSHLTP